MPMASSQTRRTSFQSRLEPCSCWRLMKYVEDAVELDCDGCLVYAKIEGIQRNAAYVSLSFETSQWGGSPTLRIFILFRCWQ